ncbi:MAG: ATP-binding protein [Nitrospirae bacterium]|nr:ATP-binding protein [Nitrospirota bacterium]
MYDKAGDFPGQQAPMEQPQQPQRKHSPGEMVEAEPSDGYYELSLASKIDNIPVIIAFIVEAAGFFRLDKHSLFDVRVSVEEACTNIINYSYEDSEEGNIDILIEKGKCDFVVLIRNYGKPFDPDTVDTPDMSSPLEDRKIGGLGIYFMKQFMDKVSYEYKDGVGTLTMVKKYSTVKDSPNGI